LYEVAQEGEAVTVADHLFCGIETTGDAHVNLADTTIGAMQDHLDQSGRTGTFTGDGDACRLELERIYIVMGASPVAYYRGGVEEAPGRIEGNPELSALEPMPLVGGDPGAADWDDDGMPGLPFVITDTPLGSGVRHETQRDWQEMRGVVAPGSDDFVVDVQWDFEETIIEATNPFFGSPAAPREGFPHGALWHRFDWMPGSDGVEACRQAREVLPHEPLPREAI
jgi:hypothetical protein